MKKSLLLLSIFVASLGFAQVEPVFYTEGGQNLNGYAAVAPHPIKEHPGVLILPAWKGVDAHSKESAEKLAKLGYHTFIADIYGEGKYPKDTEEASKMAGFYKENYKAYQKRIEAALQQLIKAGANPNKIVVMGYCFGGTGALEAARGALAVQGVVSFHGGLGKDAKRANEPISAKVLILHGADDPYASPADVTGVQNEMRESKADWQMIYYADAVHSFTDPYAGSDKSQGVAYNEKAAKRSWEHLLVFLKEVLK